MKKLLTTIVITGIALTGSVFAHDCNLIIDNSIESIVKSYNSNYSKYTKVIPVEAFNVALTNLKAYCCSQVIQKSCTQQEKDNLPKLYPESPYLFDHLIDVTMRRLDAIPELAYGLDPDPTGLKRRTYITEVANNPLGEQAKTIEATYKEYRTLHEDMTEYITTVMEKYNENIATISLADKYNNLCQIIKNMYDQAQTSSKTIIGGYGDKNSFFNGCRNLVKERVQRENGYVKILMAQKSTQLLDEATKAYTKKHFVEEKLMALWNLITKVKSMFQTIVQQAPVSQSCSK